MKKNNWSDGLDERLTNMEYRFYFMKEAVNIPDKEDEHLSNAIEKVFDSGYKLGLKIGKNNPKKRKK